MKIKKIEEGYSWRSIKLFLGYRKMNFKKIIILRMYIDIYLTMIYDIYYFIYFYMINIIYDIRYLMYMMIYWKYVIHVDYS